MAARALPAQDVLLQLLSYDPETGKLFWKERGPEWFTESSKRSAAQKANIWNGKNANRLISTRSAGGYLSVKIAGSNYLVHRVIWKMMTGDDPITIDHIDGDTVRNVWRNLRSVVHAVNAKNQKKSSANKSGVTGVYWSRRHSKWVARLSIGRRKIHLGYFDTLSGAAAARRDANKNHGFHENHGRNET